MQYIECNNLSLHNLKSISVRIPRNKLTVITGVSGSGKSTLVFDILDKSGQTKYLSAVGMIPDRDMVNEFDIKGLSPTVCVSQNLKRQTNPRSTVGSRTGIASLLQELFARAGETPRKDIAMSPAMFSANSASGMCYYCYGSGYQADFSIRDEFRKYMLSGRPAADMLNRSLRMPFKKYCQRKNIDMSLPFSRLDNDIKEAIMFGDDDVYFKGVEPLCREWAFAKAAPDRGKRCIICKGTGLRTEALNVTINGKNIAEYQELDIRSLHSELEAVCAECEKDPVAMHLLKLILQRCENLIGLDLGYVSLNRKIPTLSGGEFQRLLMSTFFDLSLYGLVYVFDEPTMGLHESEKQSILCKIKELSKKGNTVLVVEHDLGALKLADYIIELGPGGGTEGGEIVFEGAYDEFIRSGRSVISNTVRQMRRVSMDSGCNLENCIRLENINTNNLKHVNVSIPFNKLVGIVGVSGSGKSSLISQTLVPLLDAESDDEDSVINKQTLSACGISGSEKIKKRRYVSQKPIGRNKKSMVVSYIQVWDEIRKLYLKQALAEGKEFKTGHFSFNSEGACEKCMGEGEITAAGMHFTCDYCNGTRFKREVLDIKVRGYNITDILDITIQEAKGLFESEPRIKTTLAVLDKLGLGYLKLGQSTKHISGGEAQRIKLALELCKESSTNSLYVLDEPTSGLSCRDTEKLLGIIKELVAKNNTVIVIEHDLQMITMCDWLIEMGPGSGKAGGNVIAEGSVKDMIENKNSLIGVYCKEFIRNMENKK